MQMRCKEKEEDKQYDGRMLPTEVQKEKKFGVHPVGHLIEMFKDFQSFDVENCRMRKKATIFCS